MGTFPGLTRFSIEHWEESKQVGSQDISHYTLEVEPPLIRMYTFVKDLCLGRGVEMGLDHIPSGWRDGLDEDNAPGVVVEDLIEFVEERS